ncbi:Protein-tyrosine phosphatase-like protein, partial [Elaphomyces granulatus]
NLAKQLSRSCFGSCPGLSSGQNPPQTQTPGPPTGPGSSAGETAATALHSCFSRKFHLHPPSLGLASTGSRASKKARRVLGRFGTFRQRAAARMALSPIRIDTSLVQGTKRGLSHDDDEDLQLASAIEQHSSNDHDLHLPPFLRQPSLDIRRKFEELEWLQRSRLAEGLQANDPSHRWALETTSEVKARNRYFNVQAWANSRIHLKVPEGECDFINASPIVLKDSSSGDERRYIATQAPKAGQLAHFWHMVFHETKEVAVIVMLTQTMEAGREKCAQYFPLDLENASMELQAEATDPFVNDDMRGTANESMLGMITLLESTFDEECGSDIRRLELTMGSHSKVVWHFLFAGWADYSRPEGAGREALLRLIETSASKSPPDSPRIVHCSAGVGRTGTFIALDHLLQELEPGKLLKITDSNTDPVFETVNQLREQRMTMVYNEMQLQFIYEVLKEQADLKLGGTKADGGSDLRSPKVARLSTDSDYEVSKKPELEPMPERFSTLTRSWSGTPGGSDNE